MSLPRKKTSSSPFCFKSSIGNKPKDTFYEEDRSKILPQEPIKFVNKQLKHEIQLSSKNLFPNPLKFDECYRSKSSLPEIAIDSTNKLIPKYKIPQSGKKIDFDRLRKVSDFLQITDIWHTNPAGSKKDINLEMPSSRKTKDIQNVPKKTTNIIEIRSSNIIKIDKFQGEKNKSPSKILFEKKNKEKSLDHKKDEKYDQKPITKTVQVLLSSRNTDLSASIQRPHSKTVIQNDSKFLKIDKITEKEHQGSELINQLPKSSQNILPLKNGNNKMKKYLEQDKEKVEVQPEKNKESYQIEDKDSKKEVNIKIQSEKVFFQSNNGKISEIKDSNNTKSEKSKSIISTTQSKDNLVKQSLYQVRKKTPNKAISTTVQIRKFFSEFDNFTIKPNQEESKLLCQNSADSSSSKCSKGITLTQQQTSKRILTNGSSVKKSDDIKPIEVLMIKPFLENSSLKTLTQNPIRSKSQTYEEKRTENKSNDQKFTIKKIQTSHSTDKSKAKPINSASHIYTEHSFRLKEIDFVQKAQMFADWIASASKSVPMVQPSIVEFPKYKSIFGIGYNTHVGKYREYNEDEISVTISEKILSNQKLKGFLNDPIESFGIFSIFDGHGGSGCAKFLKANLHYHLIEKSFKLKEEFISKIRHLYQKLEIFYREKCLELNLPFSGSCAVSLVVINQTLYTINVGDSRCILSLNDGKTVTSITHDHKPELESEFLRIKKTGGKIYRTLFNKTNKSLKHECADKFSDIKHFEASSKQNPEYESGPWRISPGSLSVSRTFGDFECKFEKLGGISGMVISEPDVHEINIGNADFAILGCFLKR